MHFSKIAHKVAKSKYFFISKMNRTLWYIPFPMIYSSLGVSFILQKLSGAGAPRTISISYSAKRAVESPHNEPRQNELPDITKFAVEQTKSPVF